MVNPPENQSYKLIDRTSNREEKQGGQFSVFKVSDGVTDDNKISWIKNFLNSSKLFLIATNRQKLNHPILRKKPKKLESFWKAQSKIK